MSKVSANILLVFDHWEDQECKPIPFEEISPALDMEFHSGCTYKGKIEVPWDVFDLLNKAIRGNKKIPVFRIVRDDTNE